MKKLFDFIYGFFNAPDDATTINMLSSEMLLLIFSFLPCKDLLNAARVNKTWHAIFQDESLNRIFKAEILRRQHVRFDWLALFYENEDQRKIYNAKFFSLPDSREGLKTFEIKHHRLRVNVVGEPPKNECLSSLNQVLSS